MHRASVYSIAYSNVYSKNCAKLLKCDKLSYYFTNKTKRHSVNSVTIASYYINLIT